jgi:cell shape-determining protein MreC
MRYRIRRIRKPQIFALLMFAGVAALFLPRHFFGPMRNLVSLAAYGPQKAVTGTVRAIDAGVASLTSKSVPSEQYELLQREVLALRNEKASLYRQRDQLEAKLSSFNSMRKYGFKDGTLIPAAILACDAAAGREALLLGKGKLSNLKNGEWVASRFLIGAGREDGIVDQSAVLARECLIGWIEDASQVTARVVLLSDPIARRGTSALIQRKGKCLSENGHEVSFSLEGAGGGEMRLIDISHDYYEKRLIAEGDEVLSQPTPQLPVSLVIGYITRFERVRQKPVYFTAVVKPPFDPRKLEQVFVVDVPPQAVPGVR